MHPAVRGVGGDSGIRVPGPQVRQGAAFPRLDLAPVVRQLNGVGVAGEGGAKATGTDLGQLRGSPTNTRVPPALLVWVSSAARVRVSAMDASSTTRTRRGVVQPVVLCPGRSAEW